MDQSKMSKLVVYHQYSSLQGLDMNDESLIAMLKANEQIIKQAKGVEPLNSRLKSTAPMSETSSSSNAPGRSLFTFERYIAHKIKEERKIRKQRFCKKPSQTKPMVRGTALNLPMDTILVSEKLCKWMGSPEIERYLTNRDMLERRRQREKELEEYELIRVQENKLKLQAIKELNIRNQQFLFQVNRSAENNSKTLEPADNQKFDKSLDEVSKISQHSRRNNSFSVTVGDNTLSTLHPRPPVPRRKFRPKIQKKEEFILDQFIQSQTFKRSSSYTKLAVELKNLRSQCVTILNKNTILFEMNGTINRQMASLTKIMTCILTLMLCKKYYAQLSTVIKVSRKAASMNGTTANLQAGDKLTIMDLLHGMMLPSGNDAAYALAQHFGRVIFQHTQEFKQLKEKGLAKDMNFKDDKIYSSTETNLEYFVGEMNILAQYLKLENTKFSNPHGLSDKQNKSTSNDLAYLCYYSMKNPDFRKIVRTTSYKCETYNTNMRLKREMIWKNTNKLLQLEHCQGIKTGITSTAGPCMASAFAGDKFEVIIVILKTNSLSNRFKQASFLFKWSLEKFKDKMTEQESS